MVELMKRSERKLVTRSAIQTWKTLGATVENLGEFKKWKELHDGSRLSVSLTLYHIRFDGKDAYFFSDALGMVANQLTTSRKDMTDFLSAHGYMTDREFWVKELGMSDESYDETND